MKGMVSEQGTEAGTRVVHEWTCSVLSVQLPPVIVIAEANNLAVKYLISLHTDACCGVLTHFSSWK